MAPTQRLESGKPLYPFPDSRRFPLHRYDLLDQQLDAGKVNGAAAEKREGEDREKEHRSSHRSSHKSSHHKDDDKDRKSHRSSSRRRARDDEEDERRWALFFVIRDLGAWYSSTDSVQAFSIYRQH